MSPQHPDRPTPPAAPQTLAAPGQVIAGRYRVEQALGEGGMGVVVTARHIELGERVALKLLRLPVDRVKSQDVARFRREARAAARIKGPHAARAVDSGTHDGMPFIVFEFVEGESLASLLKSRGPLPLPEATRCALEACEALAEAHALGIIHRDLKPSNLMLSASADGTPTLKVLDFGIARLADEELGTLTHSSATLGSPRYMPPEQIRDPHGVDARADVWALGVTLYELITGRVPFDAFTAPAVFAAILTDPPIPPRRHCPDLPPDAEALLLRCLEKDPAARFPDVEQLALALAPFAHDGAAIAARVGRILRRRVASPPAFVEAADSNETAPPERLLDTLGQPTSVTAEDARPPAPPGAPRARSGFFWFLLAGALLPLAALLWVSLSPRPPEPSPPALSAAATAAATATASSALPAVLLAPSALVPVASAPPPAASAGRPAPPSPATGRPASSSSARPATTPTAPATATTTAPATATTATAPPTATAAPGPGTETDFGPRK